MILWILLFLLIIAISFVLAYQSMRDFAHSPSEKDAYGLFLIRNPQALTPQVIDLIHRSVLKTGSLISLEKLFKGEKRALVIFAPNSLMKSLAPLSLLELEEYNDDVALDNTFSFEVGSKDSALFHLTNTPSISKHMPKLSDGEQIWWQIILQPTSQKLFAKSTTWDNILQLLGLGKTGQNYLRNLNKLLTSRPELKSIVEQKNKQSPYSASLRVVVVSGDSQKRASLGREIEELGEGKLVKVPRPYSSKQMFEFYQKRTHSINSALALTSEEIVELLN